MSETPDTPTTTVLDEPLPPTPEQLAQRIERRAAYDEKIFLPENATGEPIIEVSPSGRYTLVIRRYSTTKASGTNNTWSYSSGTLYRGQVSDLNLIATIRRNYANFHRGWVEGHPDGHDYFLGGTDYQGQTVVQLDTCERADYIPADAYHGNAFCMAEYTPHFEHDIIHIEVLGCYWACPYERVTYEFNNPLTLPWPELRRTIAFDDDEEDIAQELRNG